MRFLLDTNVVSELTKPQPNEAVTRWVSITDEDAIFLSAVTLAEIRYGLERLDTGARRFALEKWVAELLLERFRDRILPIDETVAHTWGRVLARSERLGKRMALMDAFQAACAEVHSLMLVTRDEVGFNGFEGEIVNPWK